MANSPPPPEEALREAKRQLRAKLRSSLRKVDSQRLDEESSRIALNVLNLRAFKEATRVGLYIHCPRLHEVNTSWIVAEALNQGKQCFCPRVINSYSHMKLLHFESMSDLENVPPYGIMEPSLHYPNSQTPRLDALDVGLDVLLVPGLGFDRTGGRLGRGGGYYDAFIHACQSHARERNQPAPLLSLPLSGSPPSELCAVVGLAFEQQLQPHPVPVGPTDRPLDFVVTSRRVYCQEAAQAQGNT